MKKELTKKNWGSFVVVGLCSLMLSGVIGLSAAPPAKSSAAAAKPGSVQNNIVAKPCVNGDCVTGWQNSKRPSRPPAKSSAAAKPGSVHNNNVAKPCVNGDCVTGWQNKKRLSRPWRKWLKKQRQRQNQRQNRRQNRNQRRLVIEDPRYFSAPGKR